MLKTYSIIHLEMGRVLQEVKAEGFTLADNGMVVFHSSARSSDGVLKKYNNAVTQISTSILICEQGIPNAGNLSVMENRSSESLKEVENI